jgi:hypothetical protein
MTASRSAATNQGFKAFVVNMPNVIVCHAPRKHPEQKQVSPWNGTMTT